MRLLYICGCCTCHQSPWLCTFFLKWAAGTLFLLALKLHQSLLLFFQQNSCFQWVHCFTGCYFPTPKYTWSRIIWTCIYHIIYFVQWTAFKVATKGTSYNQAEGEPSLLSGADISWKLQDSSWFMKHKEGCQDNLKENLVFFLLLSYVRPGLCLLSGTT